MPIYTPFKHYLNAALTAVKHKISPPTDGQLASTSGVAKGDFNYITITPSKLKSILEDADSGNIGEQHTLFTQIEEQDAAIASNLDIRKRALLTLPWLINASDDVADNTKEAVDALFSRIDNLEDLIIDMMDAVGHGFAAIEISWEFIDGMWYPVGFKHQHASSFVVKNQQLRIKTQASQDGVELQPYGWIVHQHKSKSVKLQRSGLFRTLAWLYMFKHYSVNDFAEFLELYGLPIRIGKYPFGATKEEKRTLLRAVVDLGRNAAGIMPNGMEIELMNAANATKGDPFMQMINWCEKSAARVILGQTLTSGTDTATNTNALGNVHNEVRKDLLVSDAVQIAQTINAQIIQPFLAINFGQLKKAEQPKFAFDTNEYEDLALYADAIPKLVATGVKVPEAFVRKKLGIPDATDDEEILSLEQKEKDTKPTKKAELTHPHVTGCLCAGCLSTVSTSSTALSSKRKKTQSPQQLLDEQVDLIDSDQAFLNQLNPAIAQVVKVLNETNNYEQAAEALTALYPNLPSKQHEQYLQNALVFADLMGNAASK